MTAHASLPPSGADAWVHCALWPTMNALYPKPDTPATLEGEAIHHVHYVGVTQGIATARALLGTTAPNGVVIDADIVRAAAMSITAIIEAANGAQIASEYRLPPGSIHADNWGTPDNFFWANPYHLHVWDVKGGRGFVDVVRSWQIMNYVRLILDMYGIDGAREQETTVTMGIVQPNNYDGLGHVRTWAVPASSLRAYWNQLQMAAERATSQVRKAVTGAYCLHCPGRGHCGALRDSSFNVVQVTREVTPFNLPPEIAGKELGELKLAAVMLEARIKGLEDEVTVHYEKGNRSTGYVLEQTTGNASWTAEVAAVEQLGKAFGLDLMKPRAAITPTQAIAAGIPKEIVKGLSTRRRGDAKLVKVEASFAHRAFTKG